MSNDLCMGCMNKKGHSSSCPRCGYVDGTPNSPSALQPGTLLDGRYLIGAVRKMNGEGISYISLDRSNGRKVIIREFMPQTICTRNRRNGSVAERDNCGHIYRDYLSDFLEISRAVSRLGDVSAIVPILDIFESNNTAYAVYEFVNGRTLGDLVHRATRLTWEEARPLFLSLISAMSAAHSVGLVHFGLSPDSVMINREGSLVITDFGIPDARIAETELKPELNDGFSALEQYTLEDKKGKWTDVYSMCALLLFALTGKCPPSATARANNPRLNVSGSLAETIPTHVLTAIASGMQVNADMRIQSMDKLKAELSRQSDSAPARSSGGFGSAVGSAMGAVGSFTSGLVNKVRSGGQQSEEDGNLPWYKRLSQLQYGLLSTGISVLVLGIIALIIFLNVRPALQNDHSRGPTVKYKASVSGTDISLSGETYTVPDLRGVNFDIAAQSPDYLMFQILEKEDSSDYSDDYEEGQIISQSIPQNTEVPYGTPITVAVSLGSKMCQIPNIINMTVTQADMTLEEEGLRLGTQTEEYNDSVPAGCVISISGAEIGSRIERGSAVNVVVSLGAE